tara:strand:+ start:157 stop:564 length:408 start_codon:yes stop_codon:yes gene_type:complete
MAAIAFDPLEYTHELEASGVPREQAEVHAKAMTAMFLHNFDALVTKDYLESRFSEFETRVEATMDRRFMDVDKHFVDMETKLDKRFSEVHSSMDRKFAESDVRFERIEGKFLLMYWMQGLTIACVVIPAVRTLLG